MHITTSMDVAFLQDIRVSLQFDPLALKFKSHFDSSNLGEIQTLDSQIPDSMVIDLEFPNQIISSPRVYRSQGGEMPQDDIDPRFQFRDGLLYYEELLYVPEGPCRLRVLQSQHDFPLAGHFGFNKTMDFWTFEFTI